eukprot:13483828-Alexandrium_andersonii.AAC.1
MAFSVSTRLPGGRWVPESTWQGTEASDDWSISKELSGRAWRCDLARLRGALAQPRIVAHLRAAPAEPLAAHQRAALERHDTAGTMLAAGLSPAPAARHP